MSNEKKAVTPSELKTWLSGVLDFQPEDWVPNAEQWAKILDKINSLDETTASEPAPIAKTPVGRQPNPAPVTRNPRPKAPLDVDGSTAKLPEVQRKTVPQQVTVHQTGGVSVSGDGDEKVIQTGKTYKTGTIDTSKGDYQSQFS